MKESVTAFAVWSAEPLPLEAISGPIRTRVETLTSRFGVSFEATLLLTAMSLAVAIGPARFAYNPLGYSVPVSLNLIFVAEPSALLSGMAYGEFASFRKVIQSEVRRAGYEDARRRQEDLIQTRIELLRVEDILSGRRMPQIELGEISARDPEIAKEVTARAMPYALKETQMLKEKLEMTLQGLMMASYPDVVADGLTIEEVCAPERISFDVGVMNVASNGATLRSIQSSFPEQLVQLGRILAASWAGTVPFSLSSSRSHRPLVSNFWLLSREEARAFLECPTFIDHGISPLFVAVEAKSITAPEVSALADPAGWRACLDFFLTRRYVGHRAEHRLAEDAVAPFLDFVQEVDALMPEIPPGSQCSAKHWPDLALKIALLLDLGGYDPRPPQANENGQPTAGAAQPEPVAAPGRVISADTLRFAVALTKRIAGAQMGLLGSPDNSQQSTVEPDREVERMWQKLKCSGPLTQRELFKKYSKQKGSLLLPVLTRGLGVGRIVRDGDLLSAADISVSKTVSGSAASSVSDGDFCPTSDLDNPQFKNGV